MECYLPGGIAAESTIGKKFQVWSQTAKIRFVNDLLTSFNGLEGFLREVRVINPTEMPDTFGVRRLVKNSR
jgi:hypothetical protein